MAAQVAHAVAPGEGAHCRTPGPLPAAGIAGGFSCEPTAGIDPYLVERLMDRREEMLLCLFYDGAGAFTAERSWQGGPSSVAAERRDIMRATVASDARYVILAHNHPSGDPTPSREDIDVTKRLMEAGKVLGIDVLDHVVIGDGRFVSLKERNLM